jgi:DNA-binding LacI/PurR family transcriptional regulator
LSKAAVTIYDVAEKAGVGIGTVSRVLNHSQRLAPETRARVLKVISELNYQPHAFAQGLARKKAFTIAAIVPFITGYFYVELLKGVQHAVSKHKYDLILYSADDLKKTGLYIRRTLHERRVDGVLLISLGIPAKYAEALQGRKMPLVLVDAFHPAHDSITVNNKDGAYQAVRHLISLGHRSIAIVNGHLECAPAQERLAGYQQAMAEAGLETRKSLMLSSDELSGEAAILNDGFNKQAGYLAMRRLLQATGDRPTAVFMASDIQAMGAIKALREAGLRMPEDIAMVGFDDIELAEFLELTTVKQPMFKMGEQAVERLLALITNPDAERRHQRIETELVVRGSCGAAQAQPYSLS